MRAKSIKNKARVNVEMSPAELKALLKKTVAELAAVREYAALLASEVEIWRNGGNVDKSMWALPNSNRAPEPRKVISPGTIGRATTPGSGMITPGGGSSRPDTPTVFGTPNTLEKDEREEFLRRENELSDQLAERVRCLA